MPAYIHSDREPSFMSSDLKNVLRGRGIATSRTTPYNPEDNGQCELTMVPHGKPLPLL